MYLIKFKNLGRFKSDLIHGVSTRKGGKSKGPFKSMNLGFRVGDCKTDVDANYAIFCKRLGVDENRLCVANQDHTDKVKIIKGREKMGYGNFFSGVDGFITNVKNIPLMVRFADCQGVFIFDSVKKVIAAVHCGWRGNAQNIIGKSILKMVKSFKCDVKNLYVAISASLGPCCASFSDPFNELPKFMHKYVKDKRVNLWKCSFDQITESGVPKKNIEIAKRCTVCENDEFFSYRAGKKVTGHMGGVLCLK
jgi:polyphenol oxidase